MGSLLGPSVISILRFPLWLSPLTPLRSIPGVQVRGCQGCWVHHIPHSLVSHGAWPPKPKPPQMGLGLLSPCLPLVVQSRSEESQRLWSPTQDEESPRASATFPGLSRRVHAHGVSSSRAASHHRGFGCAVPAPLSLQRSCWSEKPSSVHFPEVWEGARCVSSQNL